MQKMTTATQRWNMSAKQSLANLNIKNTKLKGTGNSISALNAKLARLTVQRDRAFSTIKIRQYNQMIYQTERRLHKLKNLPPLSLSQHFGRITNDMGSTIGQALRFGGVLAAFEGVKGIVKLGTDMEQTRIAFGTMLGDVSKGNALIEKLNDFANATPFQNNDLMEASKVLLNFGISGEKVLPMLKTIGDVSGGNKHKLDSLTLAFAQVQSAGKLTGQDLLQMINAGFNPLQEISRTSGKSLSVLKDEMSQGSISAEMVTQAFQSATSKGGRFFEMLKKQSQTTAGRWSTLMGELQKVGIQIGEAMLPLLNIGIKVLTPIVAILPPIIGLFGDLFDLFAENKPLLWGLVAVGGAWATSWGVANFALIKTAITTKLLTAAQWDWNAAMKANMIGLIVTGIVALAAGIYWAYKKFDWFRGAVWAGWEAIKTFGESLYNYVLLPFKTLWSIIKGVGKALYLVFTKADFSGAWDAIKDMGIKMYGLAFSRYFFKLEVF